MYSTKSESELSWFQQHALTSTKLIERYKPEKTASIIDVGGGASTLVDGLLTNGYQNINVLDLSNAALSKSRSRLEGKSSEVKWIVADVTDAALPADEFDVWHDRAVFHFLTSHEERQAYIKNVLRSVTKDGLVIVATFAKDGPKFCSGLPVRRYSASQLHAEFGDSFLLLGEERDTHRTPLGKAQKFVYCCFRKLI